MHLIIISVCVYVSRGGGVCEGGVWDFILKLVEGVVLGLVSNYVEKNILLPPTQSGFR